MPNLSPAPQRPKKPATRVVAALGALLALALLGAPAAEIGAAPAAEARLRATLAALVENGGVAVGAPGGRGTPFFYGRGSYLPASIIKLATALAAFQHLGPDYRFRTEVYLDGEHNLYVKGWGDPLLISEEWVRIAAELAAAGALAPPLGSLFLDDSAIPRDLRVDGAANSTNPYDARLGALVTNFNTIFVDVAANGTVTSAEAQTPLTPSAEEMASSLPAGRHRINFARRPGAGVRYSGELARAFLERAGARFGGRVRRRPVPPGLTPVLVHRSSKPLPEVVRGMLEFSNNFVANQIVLAMALEKEGAPAALEPGLALVARTLTGAVGLKPKEFSLVEGSGLSRNNRISLAGMLKVVEFFRPWQNLLRTYGRRPWTGVAKTGTLTGVYSLAGFLPGPAGNRRAFVIMLNQPRNSRGAVFRAIARAFLRP